MEIFAPLVGVTFRGKEARALVQTFTPGEAPFLSLEAEPTNEYDPFAVRVNEESFGHIGYLARQNNNEIFRALSDDPELPVHIEIVSFENTIKPVLMISWN